MGYGPFQNKTLTTYPNTQTKEIVDIPVAQAPLFLPCLVSKPSMFGSKASFEPHPYPHERSFEMQTKSLIESKEGSFSKIYMLFMS